MLKATFAAQLESTLKLSFHIVHVGLGFCKQISCGKYHLDIQALQPTIYSEMEMEECAGDCMCEIVQSGVCAVLLNLPCAGAV